MISMLRGIVAHVSGPLVTIDVHGVGYEVHCSSSVLSAIVPGNDIRLVVYTDVKQDSIRLYGFSDELEKQVFILLIQVQGVGPRTAAEVVSRIEKRELLRAIGSGDSYKLQSIKGIGRKTSERIIVELKDKVAEVATARHGLSLTVEQEELAPLEDAVQALEALGFARRDAERAVQEAEQQGLLSGLNSGQIVKEALRFV